MIYTHLESLKEEYVWRWPQVDTANAWWLAYSEEFPTRRSSLRHGWNNLHKPGILLCHSYGPKQCFQFWHHPQLCVASLQSYKQRMLEVFLPTISCNPSLASLVDKFSDEVVSAFRQGNIPDGRTETIVDMSECTEQLRDAFTSFVYTKQHPQMIRGCFGVGSYLKMRWVTLQLL